MNIKTMFLAAVALCFTALPPPAQAQDAFRRRVADEGTPGINVLRLASAMADTETITVNGVVWEASYDNAVTTGRIAINLSAAGTKSSRILTATANPTAGETVTIDSTAYTFRASVATTANEVLIGADAEASYNNLVAAINHGTGSGTLYGSATVAHTTVTAAEGTDVAAALTLTSDNTELTDGDTVTIGSTVYRFKDTMAQAYDVQRHGTTADTTLANLRAAINASGTAGTEYFAGTLIHPTVSCGAVTSHAVIATAKTAGAAGNLIATAEGSTHLSWTGGGLFLTGGSDKTVATARYPGTAGDSIATTETLGAGSWASSTLTGGAQASAEEGTDAFVLATNASVASPVNAVKIGANEVLCYTRVLSKNWTCSETLAGSNNVWSASSFYGGTVGKITDPPLTAISRTATATEVTLQTMHFMFSFSPSGAIIQVRNTDGTLKAVDGAMTISGRRVTWASSGSTDIDADDVVSVVAW